tara:strand:- start:7317 stop:10724 length:3408 start_codon:yes stop_codon:yes gene_type:complete
MRLCILFFVLLSSFSYSQNEAIETIVQKGHIQPISSIAWHPSGNYFASGSVDHSIILWDFKSGKQIRSFNHHTGKILQLQFSKDGEKLLSSSSDNFVFLVNCLNGEVEFKYKYDEQHSYPASISFSPNEDYIFIGDNRDKFVKIKLSDQSVQYSKKGFSARVSKKSWSKDQLFEINVKNYSGVHLINRSTRDTTLIPFDKPYYYEFSPTENIVAIASNKLKAGIFDITTGKQIHYFESEKQCDGCKMKITFSEDGEYFSTFSRYEGLKTYKTTNWKLISHQKELDEASKISISKNSEWITVGEDKFQHVSLTSGKTYTSTEFKERSKSRLHPSQPIQLIGNDIFGIDAVNIKTGKTVRRFNGILNDQKQQVSSLNYSSWYNRNIINHLKLRPGISLDPKGKYLAIGKIDTSVVIQDLESGNLLPRFIHHSSPIFSVIFHPTGPLVITGDAEGYMKLWNYKERRLIWEFRPHVRYIFSAAFNEAGDELITSSWDGVVKHWKISKNRSQPKLIDAIDFKNNTGFKVSFSPRDLYLAIGDVEKNMRLYEADTKSRIDKFIGHSKTISDFCFFKKDGQQMLATVSRDGWLKIWDFNTGTLLDKFSNQDRSAMLSVCHLPDSEMLIVGNANRSVYGYNYRSRKLIFEKIAHNSGVNWVQWNPSMNEILTRDVTGEIKHWELQDMDLSLKYTLHVIDRNEWLLLSPNGSFEGTSKAMQQINYVQGLKALEIDLFFDKYYEPKLFDQLKNKKETDDRGLNQLMNDIPTFQLKYKTFQNEMVNVNPDSVYKHNSKTLNLSIDYTKSEEKVKSIAVFNNAKRTSTIDVQSNPVFRGVAKEKSFDITLVPGINKIKLELITENELRSPSKTLTIRYDTLIGRRELFIVSMGINKYENPNYNLNYARNDAKTFSDQLTKNAAFLFEDVHSIELFNNNVTKTEVLSKMNELKSKIGPEDVFVFYYAGHGVMIPNPKSDESNFFLVMNDITNMYGEYSQMVDKGLSGSSLFEIAKDISAQKQLFVIDACQSGGALKSASFRGVEREKAIAKLARSSGTFFITASQEMEYANESSDLKHGVFTYAILELMKAESELARDFSADEIITVNELKTYVESRVPELSQKYKGSPQYPTGYSFGNDFPLIGKDR